MIDEIRVFVIDDIERQTRNNILELLHLLQKWPTKINLPPEAAGMPLIAPPALRTVHGKGRVSGIHGNDGLLAKITCATVQAALVAPQKPALLTTIGAECWRRDRIFLTFQNG